MNLPIYGITKYITCTWKESPDHSACPPPLAARQRWCAGVGLVLLRTEAEEIHLKRGKAYAARVRPASQERVRESTQFSERIESTPSYIL